MFTRKGSEKKWEKQHELESSALKKSSASLKGDIID